MNDFLKLNTMKFLIILSVLMFSACGMQGDLYLPEENAETTPAK
jgi:predicted small lipoprotein YifL